MLQLQLSQLQLQIYQFNMLIKLDNFYNYPTIYNHQHHHLYINQENKNNNHYDQDRKHLNIHQIQCINEVPKVLMMWVSKYISQFNCCYYLQNKQLQEFWSILQQPHNYYHQLYIMDTKSVH
ncbi:unnamed protein product [Paramecium sonneborni]|uniref:Uncharacterized protein n=1 Tax=Paramecium sonneborni TaxID=65129 RepID=A0A8S1RDE9_9CILI|nr:unnamed protein product [Paramecium sonneborni]